MSTFSGTTGTQVFELDISSFDSKGVDAYLYMHETEVRTPFSVPIVRSTWLARGWQELQPHTSCKGTDYSFQVGKNKRTDFLLNMFTSWQSPAVTLKEVDKPYLPYHYTGQAKIFINNEWHNLSDSSDQFDDESTEVAKPRFSAQWTKDLLVNYLSNYDMSVNGRIREPIDRHKMLADLQHLTDKHTRDRLSKAAGNTEQLILPTVSSYKGSGEISEIPSVKDLAHMPVWSWMTNRFINSNDVVDKSTNFPCLQYYDNHIGFHIGHMESGDITDLLSIRREILHPLHDLNGRVYDIKIGEASVYQSVDGYNATDPSNCFPNRHADKIDIGQFVLDGKVPFGVPTNTYARLSNKMYANGVSGVEPSVAIDVAKLKGDVKPPQMFAEFACVSKAEREKHRRSSFSKLMVYKKTNTISQEVSPGNDVVFDLKSGFGNISHWQFMVENKTARECGTWGNYTNDVDIDGSPAAHDRCSVVYNQNAYAIRDMPAVFFDLVVPITASAAVPDENSGVGLFSKSMLISSPQEISGSFTPSACHEKNRIGSLYFKIKTRSSMGDEEYRARVRHEQRRISVTGGYVVGGNDEALLSRTPTSAYEAHLLITSYDIDKCSSFSKGKVGGMPPSYMDNRSEATIGHHSSDFDQF